RNSSITAFSNGWNRKPAISRSWIIQRFTLKWFTPLSSKRFERLERIEPFERPPVRLVSRAYSARKCPRCRAADQSALAQPRNPAASQVQLDSSRSNKARDPDQGSPSPLPVRRRRRARRRQTPQHSVPVHD